MNFCKRRAWVLSSQKDKKNKKCNRLIGFTLFTAEIMPGGPRNIILCGATFLLTALFYSPTWPLLHCGIAVFARRIGVMQRANHVLIQELH
jgi:hypothetical protein